MGRMDAALGHGVSVSDRREIGELVRIPTAEL
jgi:hypothetical protein